MLSITRVNDNHNKHYNIFFVELIQIIELTACNLLATRIFASPGPGIEHGAPLALQLALLFNPELLL